MTDPDPTTLLWNKVKTSLAGNPDFPPSLAGFINLVQPKGILDGTLYLQVPNDLARQMIEKRVTSNILLVTLSQIDSEITRFSIDINPEMQQNIHPVNTTDPSLNTVVPFPYQPDRNKSHINPKYTFENFVVGGSNRFSYAAAFGVSEAPSMSYNPLFIHGNSGLGKTHLLHAIGNAAKENFPNIVVHYVSSEEFTNDFINSIQNNRTSDFQSRYRGVDVLLIDDIQFLRGKESTQEAFFHTFNTLHNHNKQVVITSDVSPKQLTGFEERMLSRFDWGLVADVQAPELETRIAILKKKAESDNLDVPAEIIEYIATKIYSNIRELEGTLIRITAFANLTQTVIDMSLVQTVLKDIIILDEDNIISPIEIISHTSNYFKISPDVLYGTSRSHDVTMARQIAMYLCRELTSLSLPKIGHLFDRDHTTVMYANRKITELMKERRSLYNQVTELISQIKKDQHHKK